MANMRDYLSIDDDKLKRAFAIKEKLEKAEITLEEAKAAMKKEVVSITPAEIAYMEQSFKPFEEDECKKEKIQNMLALYEDILETSLPSLPHDHPLSCYHRENEALKGILLEIEDLIQYPLIKNQWLEIYERLVEHRTHLSRKQNQLYPVLEQKGFDRPTTTMWTLDNFVRDEVQASYLLLQEDRDDEFIASQTTLIEDLRDLIEKEENVLLPTSLAMISEEEFEQMKEGDREIGFAWIELEPQQESIPKTKEITADQALIQDLSHLIQKHGLAWNSDTELEVARGRLTLEQINLIFRHTPVDFSYVDEHDIVRFYSDTRHRIFPRSKNVIGRNVENCHPRSSVHVVKEIVEKFRSGEQDTAEFWINKPGLFIYITYVAVRDDEGRFRGVLEMMQDCTRIRALEGSQTLLSWAGEDTEDEGDPSLVQEEQNSLDRSALRALLPLKPSTRLADLLEAYPALKGKLPLIHSKFKMLQTPLARIMIPQATIQLMSERSKMELSELIDKLTELIQEELDKPGA